MATAAFIGLRGLPLDHIQGLPWTTIQGQACRSRHEAVWRASLIVGLVDTVLGGYPVVHTLVCARCPTVLCEVYVVNLQAGTSTCVAHDAMPAWAFPTGGWWHG